jgi:hypothetical protein
MKKLFVKFLPLLLLISLSCTDEKKSALMTKHSESPNIKNFKFTPQLSVCLSLITAKTNTSVAFTGINSNFVDDSDSIIDIYGLELIQNSPDTNHQMLSKGKIIRAMAEDLKPLVEEYKFLKGISIKLTSKKELNSITTSSSETSYEGAIEQINPGKFNYTMQGDTLVFEDFYYNGIPAYSGKILGDKRVGYWKYWYSNKNLKKEGQFADDEKTGTWKYWDKNGIQNDSIF